MIKTLAIDVVLLLPPEEILSVCHDINQKLRLQSKDGFRFDETHIPHITLVQQYINAEKLPDVLKVAEQVAKRFQALSLTVFEVHSMALDDGLMISGFNITPTTQIQALHKDLMDALQPFETSGDEASFFNNNGETIRQGSLRWTAQFRNKSSIKDYHPHLTPGIGVPKGIAVPFTFTASRLALCHLGNFNTCRKILWEKTLTI